MVSGNVNALLKLEKLNSLLENFSSFTSSFCLNSDEIFKIFSSISIEKSSLFKPGAANKISKLSSFSLIFTAGN